jgi:PAS domain-containing protein
VFDRLAGLAAKVLDAPIAMVTQLDDTHLHALGRVGPPDLAKGGRAAVKDTFCQHVVRSGEPLVVPDAREHELTKSLAAVKSGKALAYLGTPLALPSGVVLGTLCVADAKPRAWTREEIAILADLARLVLTEIERRADLRSHQHLRGLMDNCPAMIVAKDLEGRYLFLNPAAERVLGTADRELSAHEQEVLSAGEPVEVDETLEVEGETVLLRSVKFPLTDLAGEPYGVGDISTVITERKQIAMVGELGDAKALLRRLETAVEAAQSALSTALPEGAPK